MAEKNQLTLEKAKKLIEDYLMFSSLSIGKLIYIDFSSFSSHKIIELAESLPREFLNYCNTLDILEERMEKRNFPKF